MHKWSKEERDCSEDELLNLVSDFIKESELLGPALTEAGPVVVLLEGQLGTGKSTFAKKVIAGVAKASEWKGANPSNDWGGSPTYPLVQTYSFDWAIVHHMDLYRIKHSDELFDSGIESLIWTEETESSDRKLTKRQLVLIEWPELWPEFYGDLLAKTGKISRGRVFRLQISFSLQRPEYNRDFLLSEL